MEVLRRIRYLIKRRPLQVAVGIIFAWILVNSPAVAVAFKILNHEYVGYDIPLLYSSKLDLLLHVYGNSPEQYHFQFVIFPFIIYLLLVGGSLLSRHISGIPKWLRKWPFHIFGLILVISIVYVDYRNSPAPLDEQPAPILKEGMVAKDTIVKAIVRKNG